jgi:hypothetical protein
LTLTLLPLLSLALALLPLSLAPLQLTLLLSLPLTLTLLPALTALPLSLARRSLEPVSQLLQARQRLFLGAPFGTPGPARHGVASWSRGSTLANGSLARQNIRAVALRSRSLLYRMRVLISFCCRSPSASRNLDAAARWLPARSRADCCISLDAGELLRHTVAFPRQLARLLELAPEEGREYELDRVAERLAKFVLETLLLLGQTLGAAGKVVELLVGLLAAHASHEVPRFV